MVGCNISSGLMVTLDSSEKRQIVYILCTKTQNNFDDPYYQATNFDDPYYQTINFDDP